MKPMIKIYMKEFYYKTFTMMQKISIVSILIVSTTLLISCNNSAQKENKTVELTPVEKGLNFAMQTKAVLGKALMNAINTKGTENALAFCSSKAYHLTDSVALSINADIKRVSDKNRNPLNFANNEELTYIVKAKELLIKGEKVNPQMTETNTEMIGYYPIMMENMCLQCHGTAETEVLPNTLEKINSIYPNDKAIGYKSGELRGIWVVKMKK